MRNIAEVKKISDTTKNAKQLNTPVDREENVKKRNKVSRQKLAKAELLKSFVYQDVGQHMSDVLKNDVNSDEPMRVIRFDYGDREKRNRQWVQYMKPEIVTRCLMEPTARRAFCSKMFGFVFISFVITESVAVTTWLMPVVADILKGVIGLGLLVGSFFLFVLSFFIMCSRFSMRCPMNLVCYIFLFAASSIMSGVMVAHSGGVEVVLTIAVLTAVILLFLILAIIDMDFTAPYFYVMAVTLVLFLFSSGIFVICNVMLLRVSLIYTFVALTYSIFYVICLVLQVQMILRSKGIELRKSDWLFGAASVFISVVFVFKNILVMINQYNLI